MSGILLRSVLAFFNNFNVRITLLKVLLLAVLRSCLVIDAGQIGVSKKCFLIKAHPLYHFLLTVDEDGSSTPTEILKAEPLLHVLEL